MAPPVSIIGQYKSNGTFDFTDIKNVSIYMTSINISFLGKISDDQSSLYIDGVRYFTANSEIKLNSLTFRFTNISYNKIYANSLTIISGKKDEFNQFSLSLYDNMIEFENNIINLLNENINLTIAHDSYTDASLSLYNSMTKNSFLSFINISSYILYIDGNDFTESSSLVIHKCTTIYSNITKLSIASFYSSEHVSFITTKSVTITGELKSGTSQILYIKYSNLLQSSKISIKIDTITTYQLNLNSSLIDLIIDTFIFSDYKIPIVPCIGLTKLSTISINKAYSTDSWFTSDLNDMIFNLDFSGPQTDESLSFLMNKEWEIIKILQTEVKYNKSDNLDKILFNPNEIYGFNNHRSIVSGTFTYDNYQYFAKITFSSYLSIPYQIHMDSDNISLIDLIPTNNKYIDIICNKNNFTINLTGIKTKNNIFNITMKDSSHAIFSILTDDISDDTCIDLIYLNNIKFGNGVFQLNAKNVTLTDGCSVLTYNNPKISFDNQSEVTINHTIYNTFYRYIQGTIPLVHMFIDCYSANIKFSDDNIVIKASSKSYYFQPIDKLPNLFIHITGIKENIVLNNEGTSISKVTIKLDSPDNSGGSDIKLWGFPKLESFGGLVIDVGNLIGGSTIEMETGTDISKITLIGLYDLHDYDDEFNSKICACKDSNCKYCDENSIQTSYEELNEKISNHNGLRYAVIQISGSGDNNLPSINLGDLNFDGVTIVGVGIRPKIQIDFSAKFMNTIRFKNIYIMPKTTNDIHISYLKFESNCTFDTKFGNIQITVLDMKCDIKNLVFKELYVNRNLNVIGAQPTEGSKTKVLFAPTSALALKIPESQIILRGKVWILGGIEFDTNNAILYLDLNHQLDIVGEDGDISNLPSNIKINYNFKSVRFSGTWKDTSRYFDLDYYISDAVYLSGENIPLKVAFYPNDEKSYKIILESNSVSLAFGFETHQNEDIEIFSTINERTEFNISLLRCYGTYIPQILYKSSNIDMTVNDIYINTEKTKRRVVANLLVGINGVSSFHVTNRFDATYKSTADLFVQSYYDALSVLVRFEIENEFSGNPKIYDLFNNHTLITVNELDSFVVPREITFQTNLKGLFNYDNFDIDHKENELILYNKKQPFEDGVNLCYGCCQDTDTYVSYIMSLNNYIPNERVNVSLRICEDLRYSSDYINFNNDTLNIDELRIQGFKQYSEYKFSFGHSISHLHTFYAHIMFLNSNFSFKKATFENGTTLSGNFDFSQFNDLIFDAKTFIMNRFSSIDSDFTIEYSTKEDASGIFWYRNDIIEISINSNNQYHYGSINATTFPKAKIIFRKCPMIEASNNLSSVKQVKLIIFDTNDIYIGRYWDQTNFKMNYIVEENRKPTIYTKSFPFNSWNLMFEYPIVLDEMLKPYHFTKRIEINNNSLQLFSYNNKESFSIDLDDVLMSGNSSFYHLYEYGREGKINVKNLVIQKGISNLYDINLSNAITLESGGILNTNREFAESLNTINLEWDLNKPPLLNFSILQELETTTTVNIIYKGSSIRKIKKKFDEFLSNGTVIMINVKESILTKIQFKSENTKEFNEGEDLALECKLVNENEIHLFTTRQLYNESEIFETDSPTPSISYTPSISPEPTNSPKPTAKSDQDNQPIVPSIDDTYQSTADEIIFDGDGYHDGSNYVPVNENNEDNTINLVKSEKQEITLKATSDKKPKKDIFISPQAYETVITISSPSDGASDYGDGEFGVHANSKNPTIKLPQTEVPLKIFNNENSDITLQLLDSSNLKFMDSKTISIEEVIINNGKLKINVDNDVNYLKLNELKSYLNGKFGSYNENSIETKINSLEIYKGSSVILTNININNKLMLDSNSRIEFENNARFNDESIIEISISSFIEFGSSKIEGICKEIRLLTKSSNNLLLEEDKNVELICGVNFDCDAWKQKFQLDSVYKYSKCNQKNDEKCLVISNYDENQPPKKKKTLSTGIIVAIVIVVIVVVAAAVAVGIIFWRKKHSQKQKSEGENNDNWNEVDL